MKTLFAALFLAAAMPMAAQAQDSPDFATMTTQTETVGKAYSDAYSALDWDTLEPMLADDASFADRTSQPIFGGGLVEGKEAMMRMFREQYVGFTKLEFTTIREFASGDIFVTEGTLDWGVQTGDGRVVESVIPILSVIQVQDGKVVSHRDYADYRPFLAADAASREAASANP